MSDDPLVELLRVADAATPPEAGDEDFVGYVLGRRSRKRRIRATTAAATVVVVMLALTVMIARKPATPSPAAPFDPTATLASLSIDDQLHELTANRLLATATKVPQPELPADPDAVLLDLRQQRDRAALILVYEAEEHVRQRQPEQAAARYRRAIELFPQTHWAAVAKERLKEMST